MVSKGKNREDGRDDEDLNWDKDNATALLRREEHQQEAMIDLRALGDLSDEADEESLGGEEAVEGETCFETYCFSKDCTDALGEFLEHIGNASRFCHSASVCVAAVPWANADCFALCVPQRWKCLSWV